MAQAFREEFAAVSEQERKKLKLVNEFVDTVAKQAAAKGLTAAELANDPEAMKMVDELMERGKHNPILSADAAKRRSERMDALLKDPEFVQALRDIDKERRTLLGPKTYSQTSLRQLRANRENAKKSTGPLNTLSTRYNAVKHALLAEGVTEMDRPEEFAAYLAQCRRDLQPVGVAEEELVREIALAFLRLRRARMLEAREFTAQLNPPYEEQSLTELGLHLSKVEPKAVLCTTEIIDRGLPAPVTSEVVDRLANTYLRYGTAIEHSLGRSLKLLAQLQKARRENAAAAGPAA